MGGIYLAVLPSCDSRTSKEYVKHNQQQNLLQLLMRLNDSNVVESQILTTSPLPSLSQVYSLLIQEESQRGIYSTNTDSINKVTAFYSFKQ